MTSGLEKIRVLVVEDNHLMRLGTVTLVSSQPDMAVVGEAADGAEGLAAYLRLRPTVAVIDLRLPIMDGVQLTTAIRSADPEACVLVLTYYDGSEDVFRAMRAGARGYVTKSIEPRDVLAAVRAVAAGERFVPAAIAARLAEHALQPLLTPREHQVLDLVALGKSNRSIAEDLHLAERTVIMYVSNILEKLGVRSRTEAVAVARDRGILRTF
jgi:two-component system NarL family response regulator